MASSIRFVLSRTAPRLCARKRLLEVHFSVWVHKLSLQRQKQVWRQAQAVIAATTNAEATHNNARPCETPCRCSERIGRDRNSFKSHTTAIDQPNLWKIRVAVRPPLAAHLNQPYHRQQHPQIPTPTDKQIRTFSCPGDGGRRDRQQHERGPNNFPNGQVASGMGIVHGQSPRPERLKKVGDVRNRRIGCQPRPRQCLGGYERLRAGLGG